MNWTWKRNHLFSGSKRLENVSERSDDKFWWQNNVPHRRHQIDMQYDTTWSLYRFDSFTVRDPHRSWFYRSQSCHLSHRKTQQKHPKCVYIYIIYLCLSHHSRYCIWSVCRQYLDVTGQLLDICVYVIYIYIYMHVDLQPLATTDSGPRYSLYYWATKMIFHKPGCNQEMREIPLRSDLFNVRSWSFTQSYLL